MNFLKIKVKLGLDVCHYMDTSNNVLIEKKDEVFEVVPTISILNALKNKVLIELSNKDIREMEIKKK